MKHLSVFVFILLFIACTDNNPTNFFEANSSSETPLSSSVSVESSSSLDFLSSSIEIESSSSELSSSSAPISYGTLTDERDGQVYKTVKIGNQTWMAENLNYAYLKPFDDQDSSSWCNNNDPENCTKYGRLYTWAAAVDSVNWNDEEDVLCGMKYTDVWLNPVNQGDFNIRGVCPENWHVPSLNEWETMLDIINNSATDLKFSSGWSNDGNGTDIYGYGVLPVGYYLIGSEWVQEGNESCIWTAFGTTRNALTFSNIIQPCDRAYAMNFISNNKSVFLEDYIKKKYACSVRCVKGPSFFD